MELAINWQPFVLTLEIFAAFVLICFFATASDVWFKGKRSSKPQPKPTAWHKGEKVYLN
jgi:hypothetical protein